MKKGVLILVVMAVITVFGISSSYALSKAVAPFGSGEITTFDRFDLGAAVHGVLIQDAHTGDLLAVVQDADGRPSTSLLGYSFLYADSLSRLIWGSVNGIDWEVIGTL